MPKKFVTGRASEAVPCAACAGCAGAPEIGHIGSFSPSNRTTEVWREGRQFCWSSRMHLRRFALATVLMFWNKGTPCARERVGNASKKTISRVSISEFDIGTRPGQASQRVGHALQRAFNSLCPRAQVRECAPIGLIRQRRSDGHGLFGLRPANLPWHRQFRDLEFLHEVQVADN